MATENTVTGTEVRRGEQDTTSNETLNRGTSTSETPTSSTEDREETLQSNPELAAEEARRLRESADALEPVLGREVAPGLEEQSEDEQEPEETEEEQEEEQERPPDAPVAQPVQIKAGEGGDPKKVRSIFDLTIEDLLGPK